MIRCPSLGPLLWSALDCGHICFSSKTSNSLGCRLAATNNPHPGQKLAMSGDLGLGATITRENGWLFGNMSSPSLERKRAAKLRVGCGVQYIFNNRGTPAPQAEH